MSFASNHSHRREAALAFFWDVQDFEEEERVRPEFLGEIVENLNGKWWIQPSEKIFFCCICIFGSGIDKPGVYTRNGAWVDLQYKLTDKATGKDQVPQNKFFPRFKRYDASRDNISMMAALSHRHPLTVVVPIVVVVHSDFWELSALCK